jgi:hypothetical protein
MSARVDEGVVVPGPPVSLSVATSRDGGRPLPKEVGGEDDREVRGEFDDPGWYEDESTEAGLDDRALPALAPPGPVEDGGGTEAEAPA